MGMKPILACLLAFGAVSPTFAAATHDLVRKPGAAPTSCIQILGIRESQVRDDHTIDFVMNGRRTYRNVLPNSCPQLGFEKSFTYATSLSQLCSTDIITVLIQGGGPGLTRGASCGLGQFQEMEAAH